MGQLASACACEDSADKVHSLTLDPASVAKGDGIINMNEIATVPVGSKDFILSNHEADGTLKKPEIVRFAVSLTKSSGENFGLAHMPMEDGSQSLLIVELRPDGPMARWNAQQRAIGKQEVRRGDRRVAVMQATDVISDIDGMRELLRQNTVDFTVERWPPSVTIVLKKREPTDKYGMQTDLIIKDDGSKVLRVGRISGGILGDWNTLAAGGRRFFDVVGQFSEIIKVNDQKDDPDRMQQLLVTESSVEITFMRPDPELYNH